MKTDLMNALNQINVLTASLTEDRTGMKLEDNAKPEAIAEHNRVAGILGHTISGLTGIETNLRGLLGEEPAPVTRQKNPTPPAQSAAAAK